jgi:predicted dithiol-disulfide oxidoreductase (DUF899 family)
MLGFTKFKGGSMYVEARSDVEKKINELSMKRYEINKELQALYSELPKDEIQDYVVKTMDGKEINLSELFGDKDEMILIHNMGPSCAYCTMWADELNGVLPYLSTKAAILLECDIEHDKLNEFSKDRNWNFLVASSLGSSLKVDLGYKKDSGNVPGFSTLYKSEGKLYRHSTAPFGPGDDFCTVWYYLDRLKSGSKGWSPSFNK